LEGRGNAAFGRDGVELLELILEAAFVGYEVGGGCGWNGVGVEHRVDLGGQSRDAGTCGRCRSRVIYRVGRTFGLDLRHRVLPFEADRANIEGVGI
jgi:hypothetical protein